MKIGIDISPLQSGHKFRGVGFYLEQLKNALERYNSGHEFIYFIQNIPYEKIDLLHYPYFDPFFLFLPLRKRLPTVVTIHDLTPIVFPEHFPAGFRGNIVWQVNKRLLTSVNAVITDSDSSRRDVIRYVGIPQERVQTIYLAAGEEFQPKIKNLKLKATYKLPEKFALYVGDVTWNKNLPRLIDAIKMINIPLVLVGRALAEKNYDRTHPWNKDRLYVQEAIKNDARFHVLGFVPTEDLVGIYNLATVFVMPSLYEGFGLPILEAMRSGCPVITSREGSLPEVAGDAALFVDSYDVTSIAEGIKQVFTSKKLQVDLSRKGLARANMFSWKKTALETLHVYESIQPI